MDTPKFTGRNVPVAEIALALGISKEVIEFGLECEELRFGVVLRYDGRKHFICPDKKVWEETGYFKED